MEALRLLINLFYLLLWARIIVSWVAPRSDNPLVNFVYAATEPVLAPIRSVLPPFGGLDLSPLVLFFVLAAIERILV